MFYKNLEIVDIIEHIKSVVLPQAMPLICYVILGQIASLFIPVTIWGVILNAWKELPNSKILTFLVELLSPLEEIAVRNLEKIANLFMYGAELGCWDEPILFNQ